MAQAKKRTDWKGKALSAEDRARSFEREAERLKVELDKKAEDAKKRYSCVVYCSNCQCVSSVSVPPAKSIDGGDCIECRCVGYLKLVRKVYGDSV